MVFLDQMGRKVKIDSTPKRVVSLVPSITEFLIDIGVEVAGRTKFCIHPSEKVSSVPIIGGTKKFRFERIAELKPDLIVGNKEENYKQGIERLEGSHNIWMSNILTLKDTYDMMISLGKILGLEANTKTVISSVTENLEKAKGTKQAEVLYLIWYNPWMSAGKETFINTLLEYVGYRNCHYASRYPILLKQDIQNLNPEKILLSSEPFPFKEKHIEELRELLPKTRIERVDGEAYSWYGSRLAKVSF